MSGATNAWEWRVAIEAFGKRRTMKPVPVTTARTRREHLGLLARTIGKGPWDVEPVDLEAWFAGREWAPNTYRSRRTTVRAFYAWAVEAGQLERSPALLIPPGAVPRPRPTPVTDRAYVEALTRAGKRERLMVRLAGEHGLRRGEVAVVRPLEDVIEDLDGWTLVVHGKGGHERFVPLLDDVARELLALGEGYAFPGDDHGHLSPRWIGTLVGRLLPDGYTMHKLRHRAGTVWHDEIGDLAVVQDLLGHADPKVTRAYVAASSKRMREAVQAGAARAR